MRYVAGDVIRSGGVVCRFTVSEGKCHVQTPRQCETALVLERKPRLFHDLHPCLTCKARQTFFLQPSLPDLSADCGRLVLQSPMAMQVRVDRTPLGKLK